MTIISMNTETYPGSALVTFRNIKYINSNFKNKFSRILQLENFHFSFYSLPCRHSHMEDGREEYQV